MFLYFLGLTFILNLDFKNQFMKVKDVFLDISERKLMGKENLTAEACLENCLSEKACLAFEVTKDSGKCHLLNESAASSKKLKPNPNKDYYQRIKRKYFLCFVTGILFSIFYEICDSIYTS